MSDPTPSDAQSRDQLKRQAAEYAVTLVKSGMVVGLGSGSTAVFAVRKIGELLRDGTLTDIIGFPTSDEVEREARQAGIPLVPFDQPPSVDLTIDGADEVDDDLNLIKGGGGALLREKIVAQASRREVIVVDQAKCSPRLGTQHPLPVEVVPFGWGLQHRYLEELGARVTLRRKPDGSEYLTDHRNFILDCDFGPIADLATLAEKLSQRAGIVEHGLFLQLTDDLIVASATGIEHRQRQP